MHRVGFFQFQFSPSYPSSAYSSYSYSSYDASASCVQYGEGHGTALIANIVHQVLTAQPVQLLTAVRIIQPLAPKLEGHGTVRIVKCLKVQALTVPIIPAPLQQSQ